jgi:glycerate kinase
MLGEIARIDMNGLDERIKDTRIMVACDVTNPLTGPEGAAHVYGPQKGADPDMVKKLDTNLKQFSDLIREQLGKDIGEIPGTGAAGGLGAGLIAFLDGQLAKGVSILADKTGLDAAAARADIVITGEGGIDFQTQFGKTPYGVAQAAKKHGKPVIAVAGTVGEGVEELYSKGIDVVISIIDRPLNLDEAIQGTATLLETTGERIGRLLMLGRGL